MVGALDFPIAAGASIKAEAPCWVPAAREAGLAACSRNVACSNGHDKSIKTATRKSAMDSLIYFTKQFMRGSIAYDIGHSMQSRHSSNIYDIGHTSQETETPQCTSEGAASILNQIDPIVIDAFLLVYPNCIQRTRGVGQPIAYTLSIQLQIVLACMWLFQYSCSL